MRGLAAARAAAGLLGGARATPCWRRAGTRALSANVWVRADLGGKRGKLAVPVRASATVADLLDELAVNSRSQALLVEGTSPEARIEDALRKGFAVKIAGRDVWLEESEDCQKAQALALGPAAIPAWSLPRQAAVEHVGGDEVFSRLEQNGLVYLSKQTTDAVVLHPDLIRARFSAPLPTADPNTDLERHPARPFREALVRWSMVAGVFAVQGFLFYLTFFFLSWDIVEPITYFVGSSVSLLALLWYISTFSRFSYGEVLRRTCWHPGR